MKHKMEVFCIALMTLMLLGTQGIVQFPKGTAEILIARCDLL